MTEHSAQDYRRLARRLRDQATHSMPGPGEAMLALAESYEAKAAELERQGR